MSTPSIVRAFSFSNSNCGPVIFCSREGEEAEWCDEQWEIHVKVSM